jgi:hypothetical protein
MLRAGGITRRRRGGSGAGGITARGQNRAGIYDDARDREEFLARVEEMTKRYGDWGRDLALWIDRRRGGLTLRELGERVGGLDYSAVSEAGRTYERRRALSEIRRAEQRVLRNLSLET